MRQNRVFLQFFESGRRDAAESRLPAVLRERFSRRSDTYCPLRKRSFPLLYSRNLRLGSGGKKFVAIDLGGDAHSAALFLDPDNVSAAPNVDVVRTGHPLRQGNHEIDFASDVKSPVREEIKAAIADVAGLCAEFAAASIRDKAQRQRHVESTRFAAVGNVSHHAPGRRDSRKN